MVVAGTLGAIVLGIVVLALLASHDLFGDGSSDCDGYELDRDAWFADVDRDEAAADLVRCRTLVGRSRAGALRMLGSPSNLGREFRRPDQASYAAGVVNDGIGPGDGQVLTVRFGTDDRVIGAHLLYRPD
jgi:hypothetical protein